LRPALVLVGVVISAHGVHGEVRVKSFTAEPLALGNYGPLATEDGKQFGIASLRQHRRDELVLRLSGVETRNAAEFFIGSRLYVPRAALPEAAPGEYYHADLIDLRAESTDGAEIGRVSAVLNFGAGDILEITRPDGNTELIPFSNACVPMVDFAAGRVVVDIVAADANSE
jgi:16S rRNA processing protein RimM